MDRVWWLHHDLTASLGGAHGHGELWLPGWRCDEGHRHGWRHDDELLLDLVQDIERFDDEALGPDGAVPGRRWLRRVCGRCRAPWQVTVTDERTTGTVQLHLSTSDDPVVATVDLPVAVCGACARPVTRHGGAVTDTAADLLGWILQLVAARAPITGAQRHLPRGHDRPR